MKVGWDMSSKKDVEDRNTTEQCKAPLPPPKSAVTSAPAPLRLGHPGVPTLPARFLEGTAWDEV